MPSWSEIVEFAQEHYPIDVLDDVTFRVTWEYSSGRAQAIIVHLFESMGREWVDFSSACCDVEHLDPVEALAMNRGFAVGALALNDGIYVFRHAALLETMDPEEFEIPLKVVAKTADEIEEKYADQDVF